MIGRNGERGSGISALAARHDDDDDIYIYFRRGKIGRMSNLNKFSNIIFMQIFPVNLNKVSIILDYIIFCV